MTATATTSMISIAAAARRAAMHPNSLRYWIQRGAIATVPTPLGKVVVEESLQEFLRERAQVEDKAIASR